jgi:hypothetical protein
LIMLKKYYWKPFIDFPNKKVQNEIPDFLLGCEL